MRISENDSGFTSVQEAVVHPLSFTGYFDPPVASVVMPDNGSWFKVGQLLVNGHDAPDGLSLDLHVFDMTDPTTPRRAGRLLGAARYEFRYTPLSFGTTLVVASEVRDPTTNQSIRAVFDVVDLKDPDHPVLAYDHLILPALSTPSAAHVETWHRVTFESTLFVTLTQDGQQRGYGIDFSNPSAPVVSSPVPGMIVAANATDVYTTQTDPSGVTTLSRVSRSGGSALASQTWSNRIVDVVQSDFAGHLVVTLLPPTFMDSDDVTNWSLVEILDETTLEVLGSLELDRDATCPRVREGRALCSASGGQFVLDVRDPTRPKLQAYLDGVTNPAVDRGRIVSAQSTPLGWNIPIDTINLPQ